MKILILFLSLILTSCSVTLGTVNINDEGKSRNNTDMVQEKQVIVDTKVPISSIP